MSDKSATNLCLSDDPESFAEAATQAPRRKNDLMGAKTEEVAQVRSGPPFLDAPQICLRRRACVNFHECRREIFVRRLVHTFFSIFVQPLPANLVVPSGTFRYDSFSLLACPRWKKRQVPIDYHISVLFVILWLFLELEKKREFKKKT